MVSRLSSRYHDFQDYMKRLYASDEPMDILLRFSITGLVLGASMLLTLLFLPYFSRFLQFFIDFFSLGG